MKRRVIPQRTHWSQFWNGVSHDQALFCEAYFALCLVCCVGEYVCATSHLLHFLPCHVAAGYATPAVRHQKETQNASYAILLLGSSNCAAGFVLSFSFFLTSRNSRNFVSLGNMALHLGICCSLSHDDDTAHISRGQGLQMLPVQSRRNVSAASLTCGSPNKPDVTSLSFPQ